MRIGIVGLGWWGQTLYRRLKASSKVEVTHAADPRIAEIAALRDFSDLNLMDDVSELMSLPDLDGVIIATPHALHEKQAIEAASRGKHVFCEKPLGLSAESARRTVDACRNAGVILGVGHERRFEPALHALETMIKDGTLGQVGHVDCNWSHDGALALNPGDWRKDQRHAPAGLLTGLGVHITDWMQTAMGPVRSLSAETVKGTRMGGTDETVSVRLRFESGAFGWICNSGVTPFYFRLAAFGDAGWAEVRQFSNVDVEQAALMEVKLKGRPILLQEYQMGDPIRLNVEAWADSVCQGRPYPISENQMIHNIEILEGIVTSARDGSTVDLKSL